MNTKEKISENLTDEELLRKQRLIDAINRGLEDSKAGRVYTTEEVKEKLSRWLK